MYTLNMKLIEISVFIGKKMQNVVSGEGHR